MKRLICYAKAQTLGSWLAVAITLGLLLWLVLAGQFQVPPYGRRVQDAYVLLQGFLPLSLAVVLAGVPVAERDAGAAELYLTYPHPAWRRLLEQTGLVTLLWALLAAVATTVIHLRYAPVMNLVGVTVVPSLALGGIALAGSALARNQVGGVLAAGAWWSVDLLATGLNRVAYLFNQWNPVPGLDASIMARRLVLVGLAGVLLALWLAGRRTRWIAS